MRILLALFILACPTLALAQAGAAPRSIADCEKVKGDLAYNQCLASFGPRRGERAPRGPQPSPEQLQTEAPQGNTQQARRGRGGRALARRGGRQIIAFDTISGRRGVGRQRYGRSRLGRARVVRRGGGRARYYRRRR